MSLSILTASSLNGIITPERGATGESLIPLVGVPPEVLEWKRQVRRRHDAVFVGTRTVLVDDPGLTSHALPGRAAVRVTVDPAGRVPRHARFFDGSARTVVGVSRATPRDYLDFLAERGVEAVAAGEEQVDLRRLLAALAARGLPRVVAEGGGVLNRALLAAGLVERLYLILVPAALDAGSVNLFEGGGEPALFRLEALERMGDYVVMEYAARKALAPGPSPAPSLPPSPGR